MNGWHASAARCVVAISFLLSIHGALLSGQGPLVALVLTSATALLLMAVAAAHRLPSALPIRLGPEWSERDDPPLLSGTLTDPTVHPRRPRAPGRH